jgi:hypothetical protein
VRGIEQIRHDLLALDDSLIRVGELHEEIIVQAFVQSGLGLNIPNP